jgi:hypothetical protein
VQKNHLYYGDNLGVLREHIKDESVDLIYLDPPFNSRQDYNVLFAEKDGTPRVHRRLWLSKTPGSGTWTPKPPIRKSSCPEAEQLNISNYSAARLTL